MPHKIPDSWEPTVRRSRVDPDRTVRRDAAPPRPPDAHQPPELRQVPRPPTPAPRRYVRRRRRRRLPRWMTVLLRLALAGALFLIAATVMVALIYLIAPPPRTNVLVMGIDAREGEGNVTRTDTLILATIDPDQPYVGMLSIPRDLYVDIPGYGPQRINAAHVYAENAEEGSGPAMVEETIRENFDVPIDRYVRVNFEGFVAVVDAAGGVTIDVEHPFIDYDYPTPDYGTMVVEFDTGVQHMDGERALQYARSRHASTDFDRSARQQQVIAALTRRLTSPLNWWRLPAVGVAMAQHVETDLTWVDAVALAPAVLWVGPGNIDSRVFDQNLSYGRTTEAGASVLEPRWDAIDAVVEEMFRK